MDKAPLHHRTVPNLSYASSYKCISSHLILSNNYLTRTYPGHYLFHRSPIFQGINSSRSFSHFLCTLPQWSTTLVTEPTHFSPLFLVIYSTYWLWRIAQLLREAHSSHHHCDNRLAAIQRRISETSGDLRGVINSASTLREKLSTYADKIDKVDVKWIPRILLSWFVAMQRNA